MISSFQRPLFTDFPLSALFEAREARISEFLVKFSSAGNQQNLIPNVLRSLRVNSLNLNVAQQYVKLEPCGYLHTGEPLVGYSLNVPFTGDRELWLCSPSGITERPDGECLRTEVILGVSFCSYDEGIRKLLDRLAEIKKVITAQKEQIRQFHDRLPALIANQVA